jgi:hypothetical protein
MAELSGPVREDYEDTSKARGPLHIFFTFSPLRNLVNSRSSFRGGDDSSRPSGIASHEPGYDRRGVLVRLSDLSFTDTGHHCGAGKRVY